MYIKDSRALRSVLQVKTQIKDATHKVRIPFTQASISSILQHLPSIAITTFPPSVTVNVQTGVVILHTILNHGYVIQLA